MKELSSSDFKSMSASEITSFVRGSLCIYVDLTMEASKESKDFLPGTEEFINDYVSFIVDWMVKFPSLTRS